MENFNVEQAAENQENELKSAKSSTPSYVEKAKQQRNEEEEIRQIAQTKKQLDLDAYNKGFVLLAARFDKRKATISIDRIKNIDSENKKFEAGMHIDEHQENLSKIDSEHRDTVKKLKTEFDSLFSELKKQYPDGYRNSNKEWYNGRED